MGAEYFDEQRRQMVAAIRANMAQVAAEIGKTTLDGRVLMAMAKIPRHEFVPVEIQQYAYLNMPVPIGFGLAELIDVSMKLRTWSLCLILASPGGPSVAQSQEIRWHIKKRPASQISQK